MSDSTNGSTPNFTHTLGTFELEGRTFTRAKIPAKAWADALREVSDAEKAEEAKKTGGVMFAVSAEGLYKLCRLGVREEDRSFYDALWNDGKLEFGELADLRDWMWEQITERPFTSRMASSDGPGPSNEASSKVESSSAAEAVIH
jgi:hypothetical protein